MEKKFIILSSFLLFFLFGCNNHEINFIEITKGSSMDPSQPRIGIKITSDNELYVCKEEITNGERTGNYKYYKSNKSIKFVEYKKEILKYFDKNPSNSYFQVNDATFYQLYYVLDKKVYKSKFIESNLNNNQSRLIFKLIDSYLQRDLKQIPSYDFSIELLEEKLPPPPPL